MGYDLYFRVLEFYRYDLPQARYPLISKDSEYLRRKALGLPIYGGFCEVFTRYQKELLFADCKDFSIDEPILEYQNDYKELRQMRYMDFCIASEGIMLGCLVAQDKKNKKRKILYTVSGNSKVLESGQQNFIFVNPIVLPYQIENALYQNDSEIHRLTKIINEGKIKNVEFQNEQYYLNHLKSLEQKRTELTDESLRKVFSLYEFCCFDKKKIKLNQIIQNHNGNLPPTGTGDCCAPKLLSYAFEHDLTPVSMDEIYYGNDTKR